MGRKRKHIRIVERPITEETVAVASRDQFDLILDIDRIMRENNISSIEFISDTLSCKSRAEQLGYMITALEQIQSKLKQEVDQDPAAPIDPLPTL